MNQPFRIFISYSHKDELHRQRLDTHLAPMRREGLIAPWHDRMLEAGTDWGKQIDQNLATADIVLLLISPDFVASDYCFEKELELALKRHDAGEARVIPILIRPIDFSEMPFAKLQGLPRDAIAVSTWRDTDEAWLDVARGIRKVIKTLATNDSHRPGVASAAQPNPTPLASSRPLKILFLGATPVDQVRLALGNEVREIGRRLLETEAGRRFEIVQEWAVRPTELQTILLRHRPQIVHFSGHGNSAGELMFEDERGEARTVPIASLGKLFAILGASIRCVVLNACFSERQADAIRTHIESVVGMKNAISDQAAIAFSSSFYLGLGHGESMKTAFDLGCLQIDLAGADDSEVPVLLCQNGVDAMAVRLVPEQK